MDSPGDSATPLLSAARWKQRLVFWCGAVLVGLFISALTLLSEHAVAQLRHLLGRCPQLLFAFCPLGLALTLWITERWFPGAERSGVPQVKIALAIHENPNLRQRFVSFRIAIGKVLLTNLGLLSGASAGLGGPAIQIGASILTALSRAARFPAPYLERGFILAGSAAGFAALFSAPLAGIIFAIEELGRSLEEQVSSLVLTAIILAGMTAFVILDHYVFLGTGQVVLERGQQWLAIPICGIVGGLAGGLFSLLMIHAGGWIDRLANHRRKWLVLGLGLVIAGLGWISEGQTLGTGYPMLKQIVTDPGALSVWFPLLKASATLATVLSGIPAGLFVPSLSVGAGLGADLHQWLPLGSLPAMILLTMCAYFAGMLQTPMTAFVLVMEMTDTHELLLPLMATTFIAAATSHLLNAKPLYETLTGTLESRMQLQPE